jgi:hypothetical protein
VHIVDSEILSNQASNAGGGVFMDHGEVRRSLVADNLVSGGSAIGGGIYLRDGGG